MVSPENLRTWDTSFDELYEIGLARLRDHTIPKFEKQQGFYIGGWQDDYDNSRILIPEMFGPLHLDGDPVVCLPNRNLLLVTGSENHAGIQAMLRHAEEIVRTKPRPMNPAPLVLKDGEVAACMKDSKTSATSGAISVWACCKTGCNRILERFLLAKSPTRGLNVLKLPFSQVTPET